MSSPMPKISWGYKKRILRVESSGDSDETYFDGSPHRISTVKETVASKEVIPNDSNPGFKWLSHTPKINYENMSSVDSQMSSIKLSDSRSPRHTGSSRKLSWKEPVATSNLSQRGKHFPKPSSRGNNVVAQLNDIRNKLNKMSGKLTRSLLAGGRPLTCDEAELMLQKTQRCIQLLNELHHGSPEIVKDARSIADKIVKRVNKKIRELEEQHRASQQLSVDKANAAWFNNGSSLDFSTRSQSKVTNESAPQPSKSPAIFDDSQELPGAQYPFDSDASSSSQAQSPSQTQMTTKGLSLCGKCITTQPQSSNEGNMKLTNFHRESQQQRSEDSTPSWSNMQINGGTTKNLEQIKKNITEIQSKTREFIVADGLSQKQSDFPSQSQLQHLRNSTSPLLLTPDEGNRSETQAESQSQVRSKSDSFEGSSDMFASYDCQKMPGNESDAMEVDDGSRGKFGSVGENFENDARKSADYERVLPNGTRAAVEFDREFDEMTSVSYNTNGKTENHNDCDEMMVLSCVTGEMTRLTEEYGEVMDETNETRDCNQSPKALAENTGGCELQLNSVTVRDIDSQPLTSSSVDISPDFIENTQPVAYESVKKQFRKENSYIMKGDSSSQFGLPNNEISLPFNKETGDLMKKPWKNSLTLEDRMLIHTTQSPLKDRKSILKTNTGGSSTPKDVQFNKIVDVLGSSGVAQSNQNTAEKEKSGARSSLMKDTLVTGKDLSALTLPQSSDSLNKLEVNSAWKSSLNASDQSLSCENVLTKGTLKSRPKQDVYEESTKDSSAVQQQAEKKVVVSELDEDQRGLLEMQCERQKRMGEFQDPERSSGTNLRDNVSKDESITQMMLQDSQEIYQTQSLSFGENISPIKVSVRKSKDLLSLTQKMLMDSQDFSETQLPSEFVEASTTNLEENNNEKSLTQIMLEDSEKSCNPLSTTFVQPSVTKINYTASGKQLVKEKIMDQRGINTKSPNEFIAKSLISNLPENVICNDQSLTQMMLEDSQESLLCSRQEEIAPLKPTGAIPKVRLANAVMKSPKWGEQAQSFGKCSFQPFISSKSAVLGASFAKETSSKATEHFASQSRLFGSQESDKNKLLQRELNTLATEIRTESQSHSPNSTSRMKNDCSQTFGTVAKSQKQIFQQNMSLSNQSAAEINTFPHKSGVRSQLSQISTSQVEHEFLQPEIPAKKTKKQPLQDAFPVTRKIVPVPLTITATQVPVSADPELHRAKSQEAPKTPTNTQIEVINLDSPPLEIYGNDWWSQDVRKMMSGTELSENPMECTTQNNAMDINGHTNMQSGSLCSGNEVNLIGNVSLLSNPTSNEMGKNQIPMKQVDVQRISGSTAMDVDVAPMKSISNPNLVITNENGTQNPSAKQGLVLPGMMLPANQYNYFVVTPMVGSTTKYAQNNINSVGNQQCSGGTVSRQGFEVSIPSENMASSRNETNWQNQAEWRGTNLESQRVTSTLQQSLIGNIRNPFAVNSNQFQAHGMVFHQTQSPEIVKMPTNPMAVSSTQQHQGKNQFQNRQQVPMTLSQPQTRFEFQTLTQTTKPVQTQPCQTQNSLLRQNQAAAGSNNEERYETFDRLILNLFDYENVMKRRAMERQNSVASETQGSQSSVEQAANSADATCKITKPAGEKSSSFLSNLLYPKNLEPAQKAERDMILSLTHMRIKPAQEYAPRTEPFSWEWDNIPADVLKDLEDSSDEDE